MPLEGPSAFIGLDRVDEPGSEIGVNRQLLARHRVECEAGRDLGHTSAAAGDHHDLDEDDQNKDHAADDRVAGDKYTTNRIDNRAGLPLGQNQTTGSHRQGQSKDHREQNKSG